MKRLIVALALSVFAVAPAPAAPARPASDASVKNVRRLMKVTGVEAELKQIEAFFAKSMVDGIHQSHPDLPPEALRDVHDGVQEVFERHMEGPDGLTARTEKIMAHHFTPADIDSLIRFYESPVGRKWVEERPLVMKDVLVAGREWGVSLQPELAARVKETLQKYDAAKP